MHGTLLAAPAHNALLQRGQHTPLHSAPMPRRLWIVWLMLALLPLRGWAAASMTVPAAAVEASVQIAQAADQAAAALPACHDVAGDESTPAGGHACNLCDLCHGAVADMAQPTLLPEPPPDVSPRPAATQDTGRQAVGGLDRPPRFFLA